MTESPAAALRLRIPQTCPFCARSGYAKLEQTIQGNVIVLNWHCTLCDKEWPAAHDAELSSKS